MTDDSGDMAALLAAALATSDRAGTAGTTNNRVDGVRRLSGGANMETWALDWHLDDQNLPLILRRMPAGNAEAIDTPLQMGAMDLATEASLITLAASQGVSVPSAVLVLNEDHNLGTGYIMTRERGEALPSRILFDEKYTAARGKLAYQCGAALGRIHQIPLATVPAALRNLSMDDDLDRLQGLLDKYGNASAVHQLGLNWLRQNKPEDGRRCLVHGDFRNGNLLVDEQGLVAVLDWELAHIGDPAEDLGYLCGNVWRFGKIDKPVGGFGEYRDLLDGYRSVTGWAPCLEEIRYWEVYCALGWGIVCLTMIDMYRSGQARSLERAAVGRRMSESEIDLLLLLEGELPL
jgi:aminoglycoside phosphotransferase (APT) family kinase protein